MGKTYRHDSDSFNRNKKIRLKIGKKPKTKTKDSRLDKSPSYDSVDQEDNRD